MNYYDAREVLDRKGIRTGKWHFTKMNDNVVRPVGYCHDHPGHDTQQEARECFRRYLLDGSKEETYADWTGCVVCDTPTKKGMTPRPPLGNGHALCDDHRTIQQLEKLTDVPHQIAASY